MGTIGYECLVMFVQSEADVGSAVDVLKAHARGDETMVWFCYPKKSSRRYQARISRDTGWTPVLNLGWEGVRQIAIDEDWSGLRFRPREAISSYTRATRIGG